MICFLDESSAYATSLGLVQGDTINDSNPYYKFLLDKIPYERIPYAASLGLLHGDHLPHTTSDYKSILDKIPYNKIPYASSLGLSHGGHHYSNHFSLIIDKILDNHNTQLILTALSTIITSIIFNFIANFTF